MIKKGEGKYEELFINSLVYSNYLTNDYQAKNCSLVAIKKQ